MVRHAEGRVAVVTGGAAGIGRAFAERLSQDGFAVAIADIGDASEAVDAINASGSLAAAFLCDVASPESAGELAERVEDRFGRIDALVNNAGIYPAAPFLDITPDELDRVLRINVAGQFNVTRIALPGMLSRGWGRIVNISSTVYYAGLPNVTHYAASKGAVIGFTRSLAAEVGAQGVTVNAIAPGLVRTATTSNGPEAELFDVLAQQQAIKRTEEPTDLVGACSFLCSDDAAFITGQTLVVDGGWVRG